jgi:hypothetical protein
MNCTAHRPEHIQRLIATRRLQNLERFSHCPVTLKLDRFRIIERRAGVVAQSRSLFIRMN